MTARKKPRQPAKAKVTEEDMDKAFVEAYNKLCKLHKRTLTYAPGLRYSEEGRDYRIVVQAQVSRIEE